MRLQLHLTPNIQPVPFNHLHQLTGALHKWLGPNYLHDGLSLYSFGWLQGAERIGNSLYFPHGATWTISFADSKKAWDLARGIIKDDTVGFGMKVKQALEMPLPQTFEVLKTSKVSSLHQHHFFTDGMVVVREKREDGSREYLTWDKPAADEAMTRILQKKLEKAGFTGDHLTAQVGFNRTYAHPKTKVVEIKRIKHRGNICPVTVQGTPDAIRFAWLVGVGELTGSGFGALA